MTLKQRVRYVMDGLAPGVWLTTSGIFERLTDTTYASVQTVITAMYRADQLRRRGNPPRCEYRAGRKPVVPKKFGRPARQRMGFQALARLEKSDPAAYAAFVAADQKRV